MSALLLLLIKPPFRFTGRLRGWLLVWSAVATLTTAVSAAKRNYAVPAGDATKTLKLFSEQSGEQIVYPVDQVRGVKTNPVAGEFTAREALDAMLARSGLIAVQDEVSGALAVKISGVYKPIIASTFGIVPDPMPLQAVAVMLSEAN